MIRKLKPEDLDAVMAIWLKTNIKAHDFIAESYWQANFPMVESLLPEAEIYVYEEDKTIRGFVGLMENYIAGIFVTQDCQSHGIGKALLDFIKKSCPELSLQVYKKNVRAVRFYQREGFTVRQEQVDENTGEVELVMSWTEIA